MPYFNGGRYLPEQLDSILGQSLGRIRLTILDNGSDSENSRILLESTKNLGNVTVVRSEENHGVIGGVERLLTNTGSPFVALSDQDDIWDRDKLEISLKVLLDGGHDLVYTDLRLIDDQGHVFADSHWKNTNSRPIHGHSALPFAMKNPVAGCTIVARAELMRKALPFPSDIPMHDRWLAIAAALGRGVGVVERATMSYRQHGGNDTGSLKFGLSTLKKRFSRGGGSATAYLKRRQDGRRVLLDCISRMSKDPMEAKLARFLYCYGGLGPLGSTAFAVPYVLATLLAGRSLGLRNAFVDAMLGIAAGFASQAGKTQGCAHKSLQEK